MRQIPESTLQTMTECLVHEFSPEQVILFGSHAWGIPTEDSDLDLMVVVKDSAHSPLQRIWQARAALRQFTMPKDIIVSTRAEFDAYRNIPASLTYKVANEGRVMYEASK